ncbi:MAG: ABC transporter permease [Acidobacteria bacterium]|nr:ABC transporter permease [Acidobacteriota bacterium]
MNEKRLFFRMLIQSLARRASKVALVLLAVSVGTAAAATLINLTYDVESKMNRELRTYGANLIVIPLGAQGYMSQQQLGDLRYGQILGFAPYLYTSATIHAGSATEVVMLAGIQFKQVQQVSPYWQVQGDWGRDDDPSASMIGSQVATQLGLNPGDRFKLSLDNGRWERECIITGIVTTGEAEDGQVFINLPVVQQATGLDGKVSLLALSVLGGFEQVEAVAHQIEQQVRDVEARPLRKIALSEGRILSKVKWMMLVLTIIILVISALCVMTTMIALIVERQREIGLMKALGARHGAILSLFLSEASVLALIGGSLGYGMGVICSALIGKRLFNASISPRLETIPLILGIALIVCWVAVYAPIKRALTIKPAIVLKGE